MLALAELASAYAWHKSVGVNTSSPTEQQPEDDPEQDTDSNDRESAKDTGAN